MITHFKSGLSQIKAEDDLINRTEMYLKNKLSKQRNNSLIFFHTKLYFKTKLAFACFAFLIVAAGTGAYAYYMTPVSYLSIDINPSIELGVNKFGKVIKAEGYNSDGDTILKNTKIAGKNVESSVKFLVSSAAGSGYINDDGSTVISITSETDDSDTAEKLENEAESGANIALDENGKAAIIYKDNVSLSLREKAKEIGITAGKLNLINKLQSVDPTATVESYKGASVKEIMKAIKNNKVKNNADTDEESNIDNKEKSRDDSNPSIDDKDDELSNKNKRAEDDKNVKNQKKESENAEDDNSFKRVPENNINIDASEDKNGNKNNDYNKDLNSGNKKEYINENKCDEPNDKCNDSEDDKNLGGNGNLINPITGGNKASDDKKND